MYNTCTVPQGRIDESEWSYSLACKLPIYIYYSIYIYCRTGFKYIVKRLRFRDFEEIVFLVFQRDCICCVWYIVF